MCTTLVGNDVWYLYLGNIILLLSMEGLLLRVLCVSLVYIVFLCVDYEVNTVKADSTLKTIANSSYLAKLLSSDRI